MSAFRQWFQRVTRGSGSQSGQAVAAVKEVAEFPITASDAGKASPVDKYWGEHTVNSKPFASADESERYLQWRASVYPKFRELMHLYGNHDNEVILDYGCGPGNDVVGFALYTKARKIIGIDVSKKALSLTSNRLALHEIDSNRIKLIHSSDVLGKVPLADQSVDYINCGGVLHHTTNPQSLLREFYRVLKPNSSACIMIYNRDSLWLHLYTAYEKMIIENEFAGLDVYEAFGRNTDGVNCPIARCYASDEFIEMCEVAGFRCEYAGAYLSDTELNSYKTSAEAALADERLADEHKQFISALTFDAEGLPSFNGKYAGIGGVYYLYKD